MSETKLSYEMWRQTAKNSQHAKIGCENFLFFIFIKTKKTIFFLYIFKDQFIYIYIYIYNKNKIIIIKHVNSAR